MSDWRHQAACVDQPHLDWVLNPGHRERAICRACPAQPACLEYGQTNRLHGMWGGITIRDPLLASTLGGSYARKLRKHREAALQTVETT
jgi:hypothetical protein